MPHEPLLTLSDAATRLSISVDTLRRLYRRKQLRVVRLGLKSIRVPESEVVRLSREGVRL